MENQMLQALRAGMAKRGIDIYIVPTSDFHESEYVGDYFKCRKALTGFSGSAGVAVVTDREAGLWTDGRYFIQAANEIRDTGFTLYKMGEEGVPTVAAYVEQTLPEGGVLGFDGRVMNTTQAKRYEEIAEKKGGSLYVTEDLMDLVWEDRPDMPVGALWILTEEYSGESTTSKLARIREKVKAAGADTHLISSLYDIAWILNLRGTDIEHVPVFLSFLLITETGAALYINPADLTPEVEAYLTSCGVQVYPYEGIYEATAALEKTRRVMMDENLVNYRLYKALDGVTIANRENPSELMRAIKNETELANTRKAHIQDGVAFTKFMYWLKKNIGKMDITEYSAGEYLDSLRAAREHFLDLSFSDICAYGPNAAMMHYSADAENSAHLKPEGMLLVDSGGHYLEGTTDITRTIVLGEITDEMKMYFTTVCRSNLALANARFLYGCRGVNLDILCRGPLWQMGIDYKCGTGHGVGHILNVHEGPNGFRWRIVPERKDSGLLEEGMITTDEPGVYLEGKLGIRTENELICKKAEKNEYGQFMEFENITCAPIDLDGIDPALMSDVEKKQLNDYHKMVYEKIAPYMTEEERIWLAEYTRAI